MSKKVTWEAEDPKYGLQLTWKYDTKKELLDRIKRVGADTWDPPLQIVKVTTIREVKSPRTKKKRK